MSSAKQAVPICLLATVLTLAVLLVGCGDSGPTFVDRHGSYTKASALALLSAADTSRFSGRPTSDADSLRHASLTALRRHGASASAAADLITRTLPTAAHGVPAYVELASFGRVPATVLIEATGPAGGMLSTKRLWVLALDGRVLMVATR